MGKTVGEFLSSVNNDVVKFAGKLPKGNTILGKIQTFVSAGSVMPGYTDHVYAFHARRFPCGDSDGDCCTISQDTNYEESMGMDKYHKTIRLNGDEFHDLATLMGYTKNER